MRSTEAEQMFWDAFKYLINVLEFICSKCDPSIAELVALDWSRNLQSAEETAFLLELGLFKTLDINKPVWIKLPTFSCDRNAVKIIGHLGRSLELY